MYILRVAAFLLSYIYANISFANTALMGFSELPSDTRFIECAQCSSSELETRAIGNAYARPRGVYWYLIGSISEGSLSLIDIEVEKWPAGYQEPGGAWIRGYHPIGAQVVREFNIYVAEVKKGIPRIDIPANVSQRFPTNQAETADISHYLRSHPAINTALQTRFLIMRNLVVTVRFPDNTTAQFRLVSPLTNPGLSFVVVPNTRRDANGNRIPDPSGGSSGESAENINGIILNRPGMSAAEVAAAFGTGSSIQFFCQRIDDGPTTCSTYTRVR
jgi:hypothetical protein